MQDNRPKAVYGGFFARLAAFAVDSALAFLLTLLVSFPVSALCRLLPFGLGTAQILFTYTLKDILCYLAGAGYFVGFTYAAGKTPGKKAMNLRVINADGSVELSLLNVIFRETVGRFLCSATFGIGYLIAAVDGNKRGLHDRLCDTCVIYEKTIVVKYIRKEIQGRPAAEYDADPAAMQKGYRQHLKEKEDENSENQ